MAPQLIDLVLDDHRSIRDGLRRVRHAAGDARRELLGDLVHELVAHELAERVVVHPSVREHVLAGDELTHARCDEERYVEAILEELERVDANSEQGDKLLRRLEASVLRHHELEEQAVLPLLRVACEPATLERLGAEFLQVKGVADSSARTGHVPTRPVAALVHEAHEAIQAAFVGTDA